MANQELGSLQPVHNVKPYKHVEGTHQIEHFFRAVAGLDIDKEDIKRYYNFVEQKMRDMLLMAQRCAKANDRIRVEPRDLPITKGLQESIHAFETLIWISGWREYWTGRCRNRGSILRIATRLRRDWRPLRAG